MQQIQHQMMGYDRSSTMFSPDGRLLQVEYAKKTVKQGTSAIGMICRDGVLLVADKRISDELIIPKSVEKIFQVDDHICATASGILSDGRILIDRARLFAQQHRVTYDESIELKLLVKDICDIKQYFTQVGGARPFGVSLLFVGVNDDGELFVTDPTGIYFQYKATAIGEFENEIKSLLLKEYKEGLDINNGLKLSVKILKKVLMKEFDIKRLDVAFINNKDKKFTRLDMGEINKIIK
ncbi:MAG: archaeal proteasome endopeptidase complex subunit alpha [Nanoarchaeota archaeon]|nr:archaeal proteasome endopeptidase complex subunit alpha [Nanoarchaeota archaeon]